MRYIFLLLFIYASDVFAKNDVFLEGVIPNLDRDKVYSEVEKTFIGRKWRIVKNDSDGVTARIQHRGVDATVRIFLEGNILFYTCNGTRKINVRVPAGGSGGTKKREKTTEFCPSKWIDNLRQDTAWILQDS
jgi:hypothetical protein